MGLGDDPRVGAKADAAAPPPTSRPRGTTVSNLRENSGAHVGSYPLDVSRSKGVEAISATKQVKAR